MDDCASYQQSETPRLCARGCGFFGSPATCNLCSKCYRDFLKEKIDSSANSSVVAAVNCGPHRSIINPSANPSPCFNEGSVAATATENNNIPSNRKNRCLCCNKKVGLLGFACRCGGKFCGTHRYPEKHECIIDFKSIGRVAIANQNPLVKADKLDSRI